jgi:hypothetical protein
MKIKKKLGLTTHPKQVIITDATGCNPQKLKPKINKIIKAAHSAVTMNSFPRDDLTRPVIAKLQGYRQRVAGLLASSEVNPCVFGSRHYSINTITSSSYIFLIPFFCNLY